MQALVEVNTTEELLERLYQILAAEAKERGDTVDRISTSSFRTVEAHPVGRSGVLAFLDHYALVGWEPGDMRRAARDAYRVIGDKLARVGFTLHMVHHRNVPSIILTRKLGAEFLGMDRDGYIHYRLTLEAFKAAEAKKLHRGHTRGQKVTSTEGT